MNFYFKCYRYILKPDDKDWTIMVYCKFIMNPWCLTSNTKTKANYFHKRVLTVSFSDGSRQRYHCSCTLHSTCCGCSSALDDVILLTLFFVFLLFFFSLQHTKTFVAIHAAPDGSRTNATPVPTVLCEKQAQSCFFELWHELGTEVSVLMTTL